MSILSEVHVYTKEFAPILSTGIAKVLTLSRDLPKIALQVERLCMKN
jgi:hypothetical protein